METTQEPLPDFSARFRVLRRLGQGSMGVVYAAEDRVRGELVALKTLHNLAALDLAILKNEFRALVDLQHPNLVTLYGLFEISGRWLFTMEQVDGVGLMDWLRDRPVRTGQPAPDADVTLPPGGSQAPGPQQARPVAAPLAPSSVPRLREGMRQLAEGLAALHARGLLHRDIKPANAMVTPSGRVVLLDFGLAVDVAKRLQDPLLAGFLVGTAAYMAPEQAAGHPPQPASDWYSFGAILYEALSGAPPFVGPPRQLLAQKRATDPPPLPAGLPEDLADLAMELLDRDPDARPSGAEVLDRLGGRRPAPQLRPALVGRAALVAAAVAACGRVTAGERVVWHLHGPSGVGKTFAMESVLSALEADGWAVLRGRCHPQERLPFNAIDALIDELACELVSWSRAQIDAILPRRIHALLRLFPVLSRVDGIASFVRERPAAPEAEVDRQQAIGALRELLARLADRQRLAVFVDDIQWADEDSALLVAALLADPDPPPLAWLSCSHDLETGPLLPVLEGLAGPGWAHALAPLAEPDARALARDLMGLAEADVNADAIAAEAGGNPFLIVSTVALMRSRPTTARAPVAEVQGARIAALPADAQALLALLAISGRPLPQQIALRAVGGGAGWQTLALLRSAGMIQYPRLEPAAPASISHSLLAEAVTRRLSADALRSHHRALAEVLAASGADGALRFTHLLAGGDQAGALSCALEAAQAAEGSLAFSRSAWFYQQALSVAPDSWGGRRAALEAQARVLRRAGRGPEAGDAYLRAAALAPQPAPLQLAAAEQFLFSGRFSQGGALVEALLRAERLGRARRLGVLLVYLSLPFLRPRGARPDPHRCYRADLLRLGLGMSMSSPGVRVIGFVVRAIREGLACGEPERQLRALSMRWLICTIGPLGWLFSKPTGAALRRFTAEHPELDDRFARLAEFILAGAQASAQAGMAQGAALEALLSERGLGLGWELGPLRLMWCRLALLDGEYAMLQERLPAFLGDLRAQGQRVAEGLLQLNAGVLLALLQDQPDRAEQLVAEANGGDTGEPFLLRELFTLTARSNIDLYRQDPARALARFDAQWSRIEKLGAGSLGAIRAAAVWARLGVALAATRRGVPGARTVAQQCLWSLRWSPFPQSRFWVLLGTSVLADIDGQPEKALARLGALRRRLPQQIPHSIDQFLHDYEGRIRGGEAGAALRDGFRRWAGARGVQDPERWAGVFVP